MPQVTCYALMAVLRDEWVKEKEVQTKRLSAYVYIEHVLGAEGER